MIACVLAHDLVRAVTGGDAFLLDAAGKVRAAALRASQAGVRVGMRLRQAQALYPEAEVHPFDPQPFRQTVGELTGTLARFSDGVEVAPGFWQPGQRKRRAQPLHPSAAVIYVDLGRLRDEKTYTALAEQMVTALKAGCQIEPSVGLATGKFTAAVAARLTAPARVQIVTAGSEAAYLEGLPVTLLPLDKETQRRLALLGVATLGQVAALPPGALAAQFGQVGRLLYRLARGEDDRPVQRLVVEPVEHLTLRLHGPLADRCALETAVRDLADDLAGRLAVRGFTARTLALSLHLEHGSLWHDEVVLRQPSGDAGRLGRALTRMLGGAALHEGVVSVEVRAERLEAVQWRQLDLFGDQVAAQDRLHTLLESLALRFGDAPFCRVEVADPEHRLPEQRFHITPGAAA